MSESKLPISVYIKDVYPETTIKIRPIKTSDAVFKGWLFDSKSVEVNPIADSSYYSVRIKEGTESARITAIFG